MLFITSFLTLRLRDNPLLRERGLIGFGRLRSHHLIFIRMWLNLQRCEEISAIQLFPTEITWLFLGRKKSKYLFFCCFVFFFRNFLRTSSSGVRFLTPLNRKLTDPRPDLFVYLFIYFSFLCSSASFLAGFLRRRPDLFLMTGSEGICRNVVEFSPTMIFFHLFLMGHVSALSVVKYILGGIVGTFNF